VARPSARGLDHIVHAVRDLEAASLFYRQLGFMVGPRNRHSWGTENHIVQLDGFFIEILALTAPDLLERDVEHAGLARHFGCFQRDALLRGEGFTMLILHSDDVAGDAAAFARAGIAQSAELVFTRQGEQPDGTKVTVGFSLAFVSEPLSPDVGFAVMRQHNPSRFWSKATQAHPNSAHSVSGAVLVADNPTDHHTFLTTFTGQRELHSTSLGLIATTPRGEVEIVEPVTYSDRFGLAATVQGDAMSLVALRVGVLWPNRVLEHLARNGIAHRQQGETIIVGPEAAFGATLIFEAEQA
jgi:hypothetical protein